MTRLFRRREIGTHRVVDNATRMVLWSGSYVECAKYARAFGLCHVEEV